MPKNNSECGKREEREVVKDLETAGYRARRQPGSGNRAVDLQHDVLWHDSPAGKLHIECKYRDQTQWARLQNYRDGADILTLRCHANRKGQDGERMAFLSWDLLLRLVGEAAVRDDMSALENIEPMSASPALNEGMAYVGDWAKRARIQSAHQNPPQKPLTKRKLQGRGFSKGKRNE